jgi:3-hydroxymyristoyl/3-hydroxydecanoyl-(acyl carrier protein) dehydratase
MINNRMKTLQIEADHPSFAGHFPGNPLLPGAILLLRLQALAEDDYAGWHLTKVNSVKFLSPVLPGETLEVNCLPGKNASLERKKLKLTVSRNQQTVCEASFTMQCGNTENQ